MLKEYNEIRAPKVTVPMPYGPAPEQRLTPEQHENLATHLLKLLRRDSEHRRRRVEHMRAVEMDLLGMVEGTGTDCDRAQKRTEGKDVAVPDAIYPFGWLTLQKFAAELLSIIMPVEAPYAVVTKTGEQEMADGISRAFRHMGVMFDHRNNMQAAVFDAIALDCTAIRFSWAKLPSANVVQNQALADAQISMPQDINGFQIEQLDPYNISWDPSCHVADLAREGEFFAEFLAPTPFKFERARVAGKNFLPRKLMDDLERAATSLDTLAPNSSENYRQSWYYYEPEIARSRAEAHNEYGSRIKESETSFTGLFTGADVHQWRTSELERIHLTKMHVRIKPSQWGLASKLTKAEQEREKFQIWEIHLAGDGYICYAAPATAKVDLLPVAVASMNFHRRFGRSFNFGNHAAQLGLLASTILNMHKRSMRKSLEGGVTIYNSKVIPLHELDDMHGGRLPAEMTMHDDDIRRHVMQLSGVPDNSSNMRDALALSEFLDGLLPTESQPMMAGLDRATTYQAQAVMATGMRSLIFYATILDGQLMVPSRFHMQHQTLLNAEDMSYVDERTQRMLDLGAEDIRQSGFYLVQSQPLIGIDRLRATNELRDMINIVFQSGGQLPPIAAMLMRHHIQLNGMPIDLQDYEQAMQEQMQMQERRLQNEEARAQGGAGPAPA